MWNELLWICYQITKLYFNRREVGGWKLVLFYFYCFIGAQLANMLCIGQLPNRRFYSHVCSGYFLPASSFNCHNILKSRLLERKNLSSIYLNILWVININERVFSYLNKKIACLKSCINFRTVNILPTTLLRLGLQRKAIERFVPNGLNVSVPLLPQYLRPAGYRNYLVGKWHLGFCHSAYLPTNRGFDYFFGQWQQVTDYHQRWGHV